VLLRRLSLSHANKPRKCYEGYDDESEKGNAGLDHDIDCWVRHEVRGRRVLLL
jgi:hypothetical protein